VRAFSSFVLWMISGGIALAQQLTPIVVPSRVPLPTLPAQSFSYYRCSCQTTATEQGRGGLPVPGGQSGFSTVRTWTGTVYATTDRDAAGKAERACAAESRGSSAGCRFCRCQR
jgi:hypothetical protein